MSNMISRSFRISAPRLFGVVVVAMALSTWPLSAQSAVDGDGVSSAGAAAFDTVPLPELARRVDDHLEEIQENLDKVLGLIVSAREEKDVVRLACLNRKALAMKSLLKINNDARQNMKEAIVFGNETGARAQYRKISFGVTNGRSLLVEAQTCVGTSVSNPGDTEVIVEIDPALANVDPYYGTQDFFFVPEDQLSSPSSQDELGGEEPVDARAPVVSGFQG